jgi:hypothetical protein
VRSSETETEAETETERDQSDPGQVECGNNQWSNHTLYSAGYSLD